MSVFYHIYRRILATDQLVARSLPAVLGYGAGLAILMGAFNYTGGRLSGYERDPDVDEYERKEQLRRNKRRPIQETLEELGEGRGVFIRIRGTLCDILTCRAGIYGPGYDERRRERIKTRYGIDVTAHTTPTA